MNGRHTPFMDYCFGMLLLTYSQVLNCFWLVRSLIFIGLPHHLNALLSRIACHSSNLCVELFVYGLQVICESVKLINLDSKRRLTGRCLLFIYWFLTTVSVITLQLVFDRFISIQKCFLINEWCICVSWNDRDDNS